MVEPQYRPDLNEQLGGSIELADDYVFPVDLPAETVRNILEDQSGDGVEVKGSTFPYFRLILEEETEIDLLHTYGKDQPVDAIAVYNPVEDETEAFYTIEELTQGSQDYSSSSSGEP